MARFEGQLFPGHLALLVHGNALRPEAVRSDRPAGHRDPVPHGGTLGHHAENGHMGFTGNIIGNALAVEFAAFQVTIVFGQGAAKGHLLVCAKDHRHEEAGAKIHAFAPALVSEGQVQGKFTVFSGDQPVVVGAGFIPAHGHRLFPRVHAVQAPGQHAVRPHVESVLFAVAHGRQQIRHAVNHGLPVPGKGFILRLPEGHPHRHGHARLHRPGRLLPGGPMGMQFRRPAHQGVQIHPFLRHRSRRKPQQQRSDQQRRKQRPGPVFSRFFLNICELLFHHNTPSIFCVLQGMVYSVIF